MNVNFLILILTLAFNSILAGTTDSGMEKNKGTVFLQADGKTEACSLIDSTGFNSSEVPENFSDNHQGFRHITQVFDQFLNKYVFAFHIHINEDKDRDTGKTDRQRIEIKTDKNSPENMTGFEGDSHLYKWKFKIPSGVKATKGFTHIHQLKAADGDDSMPLITVTLRKPSGYPECVEIIYVKPIETDPAQKGNILASAPMTEFLDEWVEVSEQAVYVHSGFYKISIMRLRDKKILLHYTNENLDLWRTGASIIRPKYGIYRSIGKDGNLKPEMQNEIFYFADFELTEKK
ncbi:MAG: hypothetical protein A2096_13745 [Spirochaetes bacterium GWF1_41_5]|nr:MAG: hypothetical protein A2096_13745 [Spirochaetes bacterium GWF1_41_5]HBE03069.1 hypothetical protein [Spirochaetia bacterium]